MKFRELLKARNVSINTLATRLKMTYNGAWRLVSSGSGFTTKKLALILAELRAVVHVTQEGEYDFILRSGACTPFAGVSTSLDDTMYYARKAIRAARANAKKHSEHQYKVFASHIGAQQNGYTRTTVGSGQETAGPGVSDQTEEGKD